MNQQFYTYASLIFFVFILIGWLFSLDAAENKDDREKRKRVIVSTVVGGLSTTVAIFFGIWMAILWTDAGTSPLVIFALSLVGGGGLTYAIVAKPQISY